MSELLDNARKRKDLLKHMILQLHEGRAPEEVRGQLVRLLGKIPYNDVVEVEQELISEGLPREEVLRLCDIHTEALEGVLDRTGEKPVPEGHPVHTFKQENRALSREVRMLEDLYGKVLTSRDAEERKALFEEIHRRFNALMDVDKHYLRKENLLFPFLEKHGITGPSTVMWGKHDEARGLLKAALEGIAGADQLSPGEAEELIDKVLRPASRAVEEMIHKEEEILFPMSMDKLSDGEWYEIQEQSLEYGYCLYDPVETWKPEEVAEAEPGGKEEKEGRIRFPSGSLTVPELTTLLNTIPFDLTFVDREDRVRYFTQGRERIFARSRAILGRNVQQCHPPSSVHVVERILDDFRSGRQDRAAFWINMNGRFIHIEYFALRDEKGEYLGTLEVSQDLTEKRRLEGEQRLLPYSGKKS